LGATLKNLPSTAWRALRDYFSGLGLFFNRKTWSHAVVFVLTLIFFLGFQLLQPNLRLLYFIAEFVPIITNVVLFVYFAGTGIFVGYLLLFVIALTKPGRNMLYESRARHFLSPLVIGGFTIFFVIVIPLFLHPSHAIMPFPQFRDYFNLAFLLCWIIFVLLQVILFGYTIVKAVKWFFGYIQVPTTNGKMARYTTVSILLLILVPLAIWGWFPILYNLLLGGRTEILPILVEIIPPIVLLLRSQGINNFTNYLLFLSPIVFIMTGILLYRRHPRISLSIASFGVIYPAMVYFYRFRVIQYFRNWTLILLNQAPEPNIFTGVFEMVLLLFTFALALQGTAKLQKEVSPNPFGLFAMMVGTLIFALSWILDPNYQLWVGVEYYGMLSAALSALLALAVFTIIPIGYGIYRMRKTSFELDEEKYTEEPTMDDLPVDEAT
jgi:hypothetical protein